MILGNEVQGPAAGGDAEYGRTRQNDQREAQDRYWECCEPLWIQRVQRQWVETWPETGYRRDYCPVKARTMVVWIREKRQDQGNVHPRRYQGIEAGLLDA